MGMLAAAGAAASAAGAVTNMIQSKKNQSAADKMRKNAQHGIDANTAAAKAKFDAALAGLSPGEQQKLKDDEASKRMAAYQGATADVPAATNVMNTTAGTPAVVKTDAAKRLGDQLAQMTAQMQAKSRLGGWDDRGLKTNINLGRSGQDISQYGTFSAGLADEAARNAEARMKYNSGIGDMLQTAGSLMMGGAGAMGGMGAGGAGIPTSGLGSAGAPMNMSGSSWMQPAQQGFFSKAKNWLTTPIG